MKPRRVACPDFAAYVVNSRSVCLSWFHLLRFFPLFLVSSWTSPPPVSLAHLKSNGIINNIIGGSGMPHQIIAEDNTIGYPLVDTHSSPNGDTRDNHHSSGSSNGGGPPRPLSEEDQKFLERVQSSVKTVQNWDTDVQLLKECRNVIPWDDLRNATGPYSNNQDDRLLQGNALFLQRMCRWFPKFMSWVNTPPCRVCGHKECEMKTVRSPETEEEKEGEAKRVEVYYCPQCKENTTTFPRYNRAKKLLETRRGRCGEYSNLFGLFCRAVGFETRLVLDLTDHLWTEVRLGDSWIMADACEGIIDEPSMYEYGWGKEGLCYMIAIAPDHIVDVTPRYTRQYLSEDFQRRRRTHTSSEDVSAMILKQLNDEVQENLTDASRQELTNQLAVESVELQTSMKSTEWTSEEKYGRGRISGSRQWKQARHESGKKRDTKGHEPNVVPGFEIETLAPPIGPTMSLLVRPNPTTRHNGIAVLDTPCAVGQADGVSLVVVDEDCLGCILQSRSFLNWEAVKEFVDRLPPQRILLMNGKCAQDDTERFDIPRLGGWNGDTDLHQGIVYIGQVDVHPDWAFFSTLDNCPTEGHEVELAVPTDRSKLRLRNERRTMPQRIAGRLPEFAMPLQTQLLASEEQKQLAFAAYCANRNSGYCGYTSKPQHPVYLLDGTSYPLERMDDAYADTANLWNTFHYLPEALVPEEEANSSLTFNIAALHHPKYNVPLEVGFFNDALGRQLIGPNNRRLPTANALRNSRLVGIYFASQWSEPCRRFTPALVEMYAHLKSVRPVHGLEIVFACRDRDPGSFNNLFGQMPWHAIPFDQSHLLIEELSRSYNVQKLPYFVVLDSVTGRVVVPADQSTQDVVEASGGQGQGIERMFMTWLERTPPETQILLSRMDLPYKDTITHYSEEKENPYLLGEPKRPNPFEPAVRIKEIFDKFVSEGIDPKTAGAQAVDVVTEERNSGPTMEPGPLNGRAMKAGTPKTVDDTVRQAFANAINRNSRHIVSQVLLTVQKFVRQTQMAPWSPSFRTFNLSSGSADRITNAEGGLALIQSLGLEVFGSNHDFKATIPVAIDLRELDTTITALLRDLKKVH